MPTGIGQEERPLEVDVPELVGARPLVAWPGHPRQARPVGARPSEQSVDLTVADLDAPPSELGGDPAAVPVGEHPDDQDRPLELGGEIAPVAAALPVAQASQPVGLEAGSPAEEGRSTAPGLGADGRDRLTVGPPAKRAVPAPDDRRRRRAQRRSTGSATLRRDEQEARSLLVMVPSRQPPGIRLDRHRHPPSEGTLASLICPGELH